MKQNKEVLVTPFHSMIDVITNSSTEIFVSHMNKTVETVKEMIAEKEKEFPTEYGEHIHVFLDNPEHYGIYDDWGITTEDMISQLEKRGFTVIPPPEGKDTKQAIIISCERGCMDPGMKSWITEEFNAELVAY